MKNLNKVKQILKECQWNPKSRKLRSRLSELGFKKVESTGVAFVNDEYVVKNFMFFCEKGRPNHAIKTIGLKGPDYDSDGVTATQWVAQERAVPMSEKCFNELFDLGYFSEKDYGFDCHAGNLGFSKNGDIICFDW